MTPHEPCDVIRIIQTRDVHEKMTFEVYLSTPTVCYSGLSSTVHETNCNKKII